MASSLEENKSEPPPRSPFPIQPNQNKTHMVENDANIKEINLPDLTDSRTVIDTRHTSYIGKVLKDMQEDSFMCDLVLNINKSDKKLRAHKCVLAANSSVLYKSIGTTEQTNANLIHYEVPHYLNVSLDTDCIEALESLLHFMYTGELMLNPCILEEVIKLSERLCVIGIETLCSTYLQELIDINNWMWVYSIVRKQNLGDEIIQKLKSFAMVNFVFLVQNNELLNLDNEFLIIILSGCNSESDCDVEGSKLEMILKWIEISKERYTILNILLECLNKNILTKVYMDTISVTHKCLISKLDQDIWKKFVSDVTFCHQEIEKQVVKEISQSENINCLLPDNLAWNHDIQNDSYPDVDNGFESDNTLPYDKDHDSGEEMDERFTEPNETERTVLRTRLKLESNQSIDYFDDTPNSQKRNKRKATYPIKLKVSKKRLKKVKNKTKLQKRTDGGKVNRSEQRIKKPKMKTCFTQVNQEEIQDEFDGAYEQTRLIEEGSLRKSEQYLNVLVKTELDISNVEQEEDGIGGIEQGIDDLIKTDPHTTEEKKEQNKLTSGIDITTNNMKQFRGKKAETGSASIYICPMEGCSYHAMRPGRLKDHIDSHSGKRKHVCVVCNKSFGMLQYLQRHKKIHIGKVVSCDLCVYTTCRNDKLQLHYKSCHPAQAVERGYMTQDSLDKKVDEKAQKSLLPKKPRKPRKRKEPLAEAEMYACEKCPRKFSTPSALKHHMKGHGASQPFLCEYCGFSTIHFASMNVHKRQHNENLRYHCSWPDCKYTAIRRSRLDDHLCAHQGIRNHICSVCGKAFSGRKHLHRHEQLHKGDKLRCAECSYESPRRDKLRDHIKKHHPATAILHGFMTQEDYNKPKPPAKPRKPRPPRTKKSQLKLIEEVNTIEQTPVMAAIQLKEERLAEDQKAVEAIDDEGIPISTAPAQLATGYIQLPPHLFTGSTVTEEVIQYISSMTSNPSQTTIHTVLQPHPAVTLGQSHPAPPSHHENLIITSGAAQAHDMTASALSISPTGHAQQEQQQQWYNYQIPM